MPYYVQYGCGSCAPEGWINFDASPRLRLERMPVVSWLTQLIERSPFPANVRAGDICRGLPLPDGSAAGVYCSHVLEHMPRADIVGALAETRRILAPGGRFRLVVPDLVWRTRRYIEAIARDDAQAADRFLESCMLGRKARPKGIAASVRGHYGLSDHLWMYDFAALKSLLQRAGFVRIRRCEFGDSGDPMFTLVEDRGRFWEGGEPELAIEAIRPTQDEAGDISLAAAK